MAKNSVFSGIPDQFPALKTDGKNTICGIYKITSPSGKIYIGQSWNVNRRISGYKEKNRWSKGGRVIERSFNKYGAKNHIFEIVHFLPNDIEQKVLDSYEQIYMDFYKDCGFELLNVKEAGAYGKHTEETKKLISLAGTGRWHTEEVKERMRKPKSTEAKQNMSLGRKKFMRPVLQFSKTGEFIEEFECTSRAIEKYNLISIKDCLVGKQNTAGGFVWKYKDVKVVEYKRIKNYNN